MSQPIISVENLSKRYFLNQGSASTGRGYRKFSDALVDGVKSPFRRLKGSPVETSRDRGSDEFWALKDVSFEVQEGEVLGIIGRNGAGKSTLLKILSRITEPTKGRVMLCGRVASLLEVGTGFHPELTGRENIFLNGAILGMTRAEIRGKFDEIVAFAEVEKFLDTPVKRYSSGMYVRLAFAVAAHLEPEILIVDEVLAVGDMEFQKKCLGKMDDVAKGGRTVLFVSHNLAALQSLCTAGVVLKSGSIDYIGSSDEAVKHYAESNQDGYATYTSPGTSSPHKVTSVEIPSLKTNGLHVSGEDLMIRITIESEEAIRMGCLSVQVINQSGVPVLNLCAHDHSATFGAKAGVTTLECVVENCWLNTGSYSLTVYVADPPGGTLFECLTQICPFTVDVRHARALYGWRSEACCYLSPERWTASTSSTGKVS